MTAVSALPDPLSSTAVLIGAATFDHLPGIPAVVNNVADLAAVLGAPDLWGLPKEQVIVVPDPNEPREVLSALHDAATRTKDTLLVYYAGHGWFTDTCGLTLSTRVTEQHRARYTAVQYADLRDIVDRSRARRRVVILDCCFSGLATSVGHRVASTAPETDVEGGYVLTSADRDEVSHAPAGQRHTAFTASLWRALHGGITTAGECLTLEDLYREVLREMTRRGLPRPRCSQSGLMGHFALVRNRAARMLTWRWRIPPSPSSPGDSEPVAPVRHGISPACVNSATTIAAAGYGSPGADGLRLLAERPTPGDDPGHALVLETMLAVREQYGDGATAAALVLASLLSGLGAVVARGYVPRQVLRELQTQVAALLSRSPGPEWSAVPVPPDRDGDIPAAVYSALGRTDVTEAVAGACHRLGPDNVTVATEPDDVQRPDTTFVLNTLTLAPNAYDGPISMVDPIVTISTDGTVDVPGISATLHRRRSDLVIVVARHVSIATVRALLHRADRMVVVRPTDPDVDLESLRRRLTDEHRETYGMARRVLVVGGTTTIESPTVPLHLPEQRRTVFVPQPTPDRISLAARSLAIARAATGGTVHGTAHTLAQITHGPSSVSDGQARLPSHVDSSDALAGAVALALTTALAAPAARLHLEDGSSANAPVVPLATVLGIISHATASAGRYLG